MSDQIYIKGLAIHAFHGVMPHEAKVGQTFTIDMTLDIDLTLAAKTDKVADTVSYDKVVEAATVAFTKQRLKLIEAAAGKVADAILATFPKVGGVSVTIHKPHAPIAATFDNVGITLTRRRNG